MQESPASTTPAAWAWTAAAYVAISAVVAFAWLGEGDVASMEGIVADGASTMLRDGDWLVPRLYGEIYNFKPPLAYWLAAASFRLFGDESPWALRLPISLCGPLLGLIVFLCVGRVAGPVTGLVSGVASITGLVFVQKLRLAEFDAPLAAGVGAATALACVVLATGRNRTHLWLSAYLALSFALLAKGVAALTFFVPGLLAAAILTRQFRVLVSRQHLLGVLLLTVVASAYVAALLARSEPEVLDQPLREALYRGAAWRVRGFLTSALKPVIFLGVFLPWTLALPLALNREWRTRLPADVQKLVTAAGGFLLGGLALYMLVPTHETRYYVPLAGALGIVAGVVACRLAVAQDFRGQVHRIAVALSAAGFGLLAIGGGVQVGFVPLPVEHRIVLGLIGLAACAAAWLGLRSRAGPHPAQTLTLAALACWAFLALFNQPRRAERRSLRTVAEAFRPDIPANQTVWIDMGDDHSSLVFYLDRPVRSFRHQEGWPPAGSYLILLPPQLAELQNDDLFDAEPIRTARKSAYEFTLCHVVRRA